MVREDVPGDARLVAYVLSEPGAGARRSDAAGAAGAAQPSAGGAAGVHGPDGVRVPGRVSADAEREGGPQGAAPAGGVARGRRTLRGRRRRRWSRTIAERVAGGAAAWSGSGCTTTSSTSAATRCL